MSFRKICWRCPAITDNPLPLWGTTKTIHDPCPAGWRVPQKSELTVLVNRNATAIPTSAQNDGGILLKYDDTGNKFYIRFTGYPPAIYQLNNVGVVGYISAVESMSVFRADGGSCSSKPEISGLRDYDAHTTRCVQEKNGIRFRFSGDWTAWCKSGCGRRRSTDKYMINCIHLHSLCVFCVLKYKLITNKKKSMNLMTKTLLEERLERTKQRYVHQQERMEICCVVCRIMQRISDK